MKAISLWEPWATSMAMGLKGIETRGWETAYRGPLLICASQKRDVEGAVLWEKLRKERILPDGAPSYASLPFGRAVAVVDLVAVVRTEFLVQSNSDEAKALRLEFFGEEWITSKCPKPEALLGNYQPGRFAWVTRNLRPLKSQRAVKGRQKLFDVADSALLGAL